MITCKEDLYDTCVCTADKELSSKYIEVAKRYGFSFSETMNDAHYYDKYPFLYINRYIERVGAGFFPSFGSANYKKLTLSDLKPTKQSTAVETLDRMGYEWHGGELWKPPLGKPKFEYEYEKVTESIFDLRDEFERGELWCKHEYARDYTQIINTQTLAQSLHGGYCFRKVEKEIDWREASHSYLSVKTGFHWSTPIAEVINDESDCFLELCRTALHARGEL